MKISTAANFKKDGGFSLVETLIALAIFSVGILAVASLQVSSRLQTRNSAEITEASAIASTQMEELMQLPFIHSDLDPATNPHQLSSGKYDIRWVITPSDLDGDGTNESKNIALAVSYNKLGGQERNIRLVFIKHED